MNEEHITMNFTLAKDMFISEMLCDICKYGLNGDCEADPPCETYRYLEGKI